MWPQNEHRTSLSDSNMILCLVDPDMMGENRSNKEDVNSGLIELDLIYSPECSLLPWGFNHEAEVWATFV